jgi:hypothetical protein
VRCRSPHRTSRILANSDRAVVGRYTDAGAAGRSTGEIGGIIRIVAVTERGAGTPRRELSHIRLCQDDGAGSLQPLYGGSVALGHEGLEHRRTIGGWHEVGFDLVLQQHRDAAKWRDLARSLEFGIEIGGLLQGKGINVLHGVQLRPGLIICCNPIEVALNEFSAGQSARSHRRVNAVDGRLDNVEGGGGLRSRRQRDGDSKYGGQHNQTMRNTTKSDAHVNAPE